MQRLCLLIVTALAAAPCLGAQFSLRVQNAAGVDQADAPVTVGVPWPAGVLRTPDALRLRDPAGAERPIQAEVLSRWPDGSVKWALLDFQASVRRGGVAAYQLDYGVGAQGEAPASPLKAGDYGEQIVVSTGAATFRLAKDRFRLFDEVTLEGQERPIVAPHNEFDGLSLEPAEDAAGRRPRPALSSRGPAKAEVETKGPVRVVVRIEGKLQAEGEAPLADYVARLHFYAGQPAARLQLTVFHREKPPAAGAPAALRVRDLTVRLPLRLDGLLFWLFAGERTRTDTHPGSLKDPPDHAELVQRAAARVPVAGNGRAACRYAVVQRNAELASGKLAGGGVSLWADAGGATVAVRHLAERNPKALRVRGTPRIEIGLLPQEAEPTKEFVAGRALTHDLLFWFAPGTPPSPAALAAAFDHPLVASVAGPDEGAGGGQWYAASGAIALAPKGRGEDEAQFPGDLERLLAACEGEAPSPAEAGFGAREARGAWGMWRHGAPLWERFDPTLALAREFLRRDDPRLLDLAHAAARHLADVATFHNVAGGDERSTGACYAPITDPRFQIPDRGAGPSLPHSALRTPHSAFELDPEASWYAGAWLTFLLTGDRAILDAALENAAFATRHADDPDTTPLAAALAVLNLSHAADVAPAFAPQHAAEFQAALDIYLGKLLDAQRLGGHGLHDDRLANAMVALEALAAYQARKPDPRIPPAILRAAEALASPAAFWSGHEKIGGLHAADGAAVKPYGTADGLVADWARHPDAAVWGLPCSPVLPWLAAAAEATGDTRFLKKARRLERVAALSPCETPLDFALRYRRGDLFAAAWERYAQGHLAPSDPAIGLHCRLECAADVALPDAGLGGCALFRPFVTLPDGSRACLVQGPGAPERPAAGVWFPFLDSPNMAEIQGAIEFRLCCRRGPVERDAVLLASGELPAHGFALRLGRKGLELAGRREGGVAAHIGPAAVEVKPGAWHHVAMAWRRGTELSLFFDGQKVGSTNAGRLGFTPFLRLPCDPKDSASEILVRDLRTWRRPPESFAAAADTSPPAAVKDLLLAPAEEGKVLLSWTAPGDDGQQGQARRYDLRISTQPFPSPLPVREGQGEGRTMGTPSPSPLPGREREGDPLASISWAEADRVPLLPAPSPAGRLDKLLLGPLPKDRRVYLALRAEDEAGNLSALSNVVQAGGNRAPTADAGPPLRQAITGSTVFFDARGSSDPDGDELACTWSNGLQGLTASRRFDKPGEYEVTAAVSDGQLTAEAATRLVVGDTLRVNFQPRRFPRCPADFVPDEGAVYSKLRGYGWRATPAGTAGFVRREPPGLPVEASTGLALPSPAEWLCDLPNGTYKVTITVGDPARLVGLRRVAIEGKEVAVVDLAHQTTPTAIADKTVAVADGQLSLQLGFPPEPPGGEINYIIIQRQ